MAVPNSHPQAEAGCLDGPLRLQLGTAVAPTLLPAQLQALSPIALAYIGDAVYELYIRGCFLVPPCRIQAYHQKVVAQVRAEKQAEHLAHLAPYLTEGEQDILRKGRNAAPRGPRRTDPQVYQQATGFEALIGYLYLSDLARLQTLLSYIDVTPTAP
jgi:ribonuclease III family protein